MTHSRKAQVFLEAMGASGINEIYLSRTQVRGTRPPSDRKGPFSKLREQVLRCTKCHELAATRHTVVFGSGNPEARLMLVGEAPGAEEDRQGLPFVGPAGQLLTKMLAAIGLSRDEVFIANVLKCRPPGNRPPQPQEIENCEPYLALQIELIHPKLICALGTFAAQTLLKTTAPISSLRNRIHDYRGIAVICTFHPSYLLRNPAEKRRSWEDLKKVRELLEKAR